MNVNPKTGIRYGVIDARNMMYLYEEITDNGVNEGYEAFKQQIVDDVTKALSNYIRKADAVDAAENLVNDLDLEYESDEDNYSYEDSDGNQFELSHLGGAPMIWCIKTNNIVKAAQLCSPCVPNAADLDGGLAADGYECYGVPVDYLEGYSSPDEVPGDYCQKQGPWYPVRIKGNLLYVRLNHNNLLEFSERLIPPREDEVNDDVNQMETDA